MNKFFVEEKVRRQWYNPEGILKDIGLREGMVFVDVGCGDGFFSILAAQVVGDKGKVYAVDANLDSVRSLREKAVKIGIGNLSTMVGRAEDTVFCDGCADIVFYSIVLHDFEDPLMVLQNARRMLRSSGVLADLDWKKETMPFGPPLNIRFSESKARSLVEKSGFRIAVINEVGKYHYLVLAKVA